MSSIAIVGAGPAGTSAAIHLVGQGHEVCLFEKSAFPRDKPCGDWLTPLALQEIEALGLDMESLRRQAGVSAPIARTALRAPSGRTSRAVLRRHGCEVQGLCVPRARLDAVLAARAVHAGCSLVRRACAEVTAQTPDFEAFDLVVDARGSAAGPVNAAGLRGYWTVRSESMVAAWADEVSIRTDPACRRGYGWVFPVDVREDRITFNIGVGLWKADIRPGHGPRERLARFLVEDPLARMVEAAAIERTRPVGFPLALGGWSSPVVGRGRWARIGDAAALADPLTGDGIGNALLSGRLLAEAVARSSSAGLGPTPAVAPGDAWQASFEASLQPELRRAWCMRQLLTGTRAKDTAAWMLDRFPGGLRERMHAALFGACGYRQAWF